MNLDREPFSALERRCMQGTLGVRGGTAWDQPGPAGTAGPPPHEAERREGVDARLHDRGVRDGLSAHSREGRDWR